MFATSTTAFRTVAGSLGTLIFAGVCLFGATAPAVAAEAPRVAHVSYGDLNLASDQGRSTLDSRIKSAARTVCFEGGRDVRSLTKEAQCVRKAVEAAQPRKMAAAADLKG